MVNFSSFHKSEITGAAAKLVVPVALTVLALRLMLQIWGYARAFRENAEQPVGIPLIEDAAAVAAKEAESVKEDSDQALY